MSFWEKTKENLSKARDAIDEATFTKEFTAEDAERVAASMNHEVDPKTLRRKKGRKAPLDRLDEDEELLYLLKGTDFDIDDNDEGHRNQLLVTDSRVVILATSITGKGSEYVVSYNDVIGVSLQRRLTSHIRIQTAGHSYKISVSLSEPTLADEVVEYIRKRKDEIDSRGQSDEDSALEKLDKLGDLRDRGVITEDEFEEKKQALMDEI